MSKSPPPPASPGTASAGSASPGRELFRDEYIVVRLDADGMVLWLVRKGRVMLFDTRAPTGRNDPEFEHAMAALRPRIDRHFARIGVLVGSAAGALQMRRWVSADGIERIASPNMDELLAVLRAGLPSR